MNYLSHLQKDKQLANIIHDPVEKLAVAKNVCLKLIESIIHQQLSTKVAKVIHRRFLELYGGKEPTLAQILNTSTETLRNVGMSNAKAQYVHNVAAFCIEHKIKDKKLYLLSDEEVIELLTQIKGVGRWTTEMLLMFTLGREDVFALDDFGIQQTMIRLYKLDKLSKKELREKMKIISTKWSPYRTYACLHLWQWKDK